MIFSDATRSKLARLAESLLIATIGGYLFNAAHFPAGWLAGAMVFAAAAALAGRPIYMPLPLFRVCAVIVGITLGGTVTPETLHGITAWPGSILLLVLCSIVMMVVTMFYLRVVHGWDLLSALLGASPGAMAQVISLASELGGDLRGIAIVQTMCVLLLIVGLPNGQIGRAHV